MGTSYSFVQWKSTPLGRNVPTYQIVNWRPTSLLNKFACYSDCSDLNEIELFDKSSYVRYHHSASHQTADSQHEKRSVPMPPFGPRLQRISKISKQKRYILRYHGDSSKIPTLTRPANNLHPMYCAFLHLEAPCIGLLRHILKSKAQNYRNCNRLFLCGSNQRKNKQGKGRFLAPKYC